MMRLRGMVFSDESPRLADETRWYTEHTALLISTLKSQKIGLSKSAGLDVELGGAIGEVRRASVRIRKGSLTDRVHQFGRSSRDVKDTDADGSRPPSAGQIPKADER